jgi:pimeloyl-ACP methyl ester carboxylesterase
MTAAMYDVGGYELSADLTPGEGPLAVFVSGLGDDGTAWNTTIESLSLPTLTYSRAGIGRSDPLPGNSPRSVAAAADELYRLLTAAGATKPYLLIGHSIGAPIALIHAARHTADVAALVLVDPSDHLMGLEVHNPELQLRDGDGDREDHATFDVIAGLADTAVSKHPLGIPTTVISSRAGRWLEIEDPAPYLPHTLAEMDTRWQQAHQRLADALSATRVVATKGGHYVQQDDPELVAQVIREICASR